MLDEGQVVELGTHDQLVALGGKYAELFALQAARFVADADADAEDRAGEDDEAAAPMAGGL